MSSHSPDWRLDKSKPRIIRRVVKKDAKGRPKVARDYKAQITMERITARVTRTCTYYKCPHEGHILPESEYAKVTDHVNGPYGAFVRSKRVVQSRDFHFDCVPPEARPLVRFLAPCNWKMVMCNNSFTGDIETRWFTSPEAWAAWVDKNHPDMRKTHHYQSNEFEQVGMDYYWSTVQHKPRFQKRSSISTRI